MRIVWPGCRGHRVVAMTRSPEHAGRLRSLGAEPVVCDVFDADELSRAVGASAREMVMHQLSDLPDRSEQLGQYAARYDRMRTQDMRNLLAAAAAASIARFLAQSVAWRPPGRGAAVDEHDRQVLGAGGVVLRYGQLYGPDTFYLHELPPRPRVHADAALNATRGLLDAPPGRGGDRRRPARPRGPEAPETPTGRREGYHQSSAERSRDREPAGSAAADVLTPAGPASRGIHHRTVLTHDVL